jgi:hypothetical protein
MQSVETRIANLVSLAEKNGKGSEAKAIIKENLGQFMERKLTELEQLTKPFAESFVESAGKNELVESFKRNLGFSEKEARIAAGLDCGSRNDGFSWDVLRDAKDKQ